jgi:hypothetical protein
MVVKTLQPGEVYMVTEPSSNPHPAMAGSLPQPQSPPSPHLLLHIRYVLVFFYYCISSYGSLYILRLPVHIYIRALCPQMNTSAIHNML